MNASFDIYAIRSAATPVRQPGAVGEELRAVDDKGRLEIEQLGQHLMKIVGQPIAEVRFAPASRTRNTALSAVALTWSSIELRQDEELTVTELVDVKRYLDSLATGPILLFTHQDVIQSIVEAIDGRRPDATTIPTASLTKLRRTPAGLSVDYVGQTPEQVIERAC